MKNYNYATYTDAVDKTTWSPYFNGETIEMWRSGKDPIFYPDVELVRFYDERKCSYQSGQPEYSGWNKKSQIFRFAWIL
jgi:hypothetical protein